MMPMKCLCCDHDVGEFPLDVGYGVPDEVMKILETARRRRNMREAERRIEGDQSFMCLDGSRFFLRGLLPVPVAGAEREFRFGVWYEIDEPAAKKVAKAWDDPAAYMALRIKGKLANRLEPFAGDSTGAVCVLAAAGPEERLIATSCDVPWVAELMRKGWTQPEHHAAIKKAFSGRPRR